MTRSWIAALAALLLAAAPAWAGHRSDYVGLSYYDVDSGLSLSLGSGGRGDYVRIGYDGRYVGYHDDGYYRRARHYDRGYYRYDRRYRDHGYRYDRGHRYYERHRGHGYRDYGYRYNRYERGYRRYDDHHRHDRYCRH